MISLGQGNLPSDGQQWAADNGRFGNPGAYTDERYIGWLERMQEFSGSCLFATAPDIVGDAPGTLMMSASMFPKIRALGFPVALVAQDGLERLLEFISWDDFDALFIGGTTDWKLSVAARDLAALAKARGKWVHMGRVNSLKRVRLAAGMGCDSVDGTYVTYAPDSHVSRVLSWMDRFDPDPLR